MDDVPIRRNRFTHKRRGHDLGGVGVCAGELLKTLVHILELLQRTELSQLRHERLVRHGTERILMFQLGDEQLQEILFTQNILGLRKEAAISRTGLLCRNCFH